MGNFIRLLSLCLSMGTAPFMLGQPETLSGVLRDAEVNWRNPADREQAVRRMRAVEARQMEKARQIARQRGEPLREVLPDGRLRVLVGVDEDDGELLYYVDRNANAAISTAADKLHQVPFSLDGSGVRVGVWENGSPRDSHVEFNDGPTSRINRVQATAYADHATHVAGTIAAFGFDPSAKGMAYRTTVDAYTSGNDSSEMTSAGATAPDQHATKIYISNHSYGFTYGWRSISGTWTWSGTGTDQNAYDPDFGQYSSTSRNFDAVHYNTPHFLAFWAAGNENTDGPSNGAEASIGGNTVSYDASIHPQNDGTYSGGFDTLGDHTTAKNVLVVGAVNDAVTDGQRDPSKATRANFSSTGPCDDGRIKPDLVGNGVGLYSTDSDNDNDYRNMQGTSMATPNLSGTAALLVDFYRQLFSGGAMRGSTLRGLLIHTATDLGNPGPDYTYGWGLVDAEKAAALLQRQADYPELKSVVEDQVSPDEPIDLYTFSWDGSSPIRATLCWTDPPGAAESSHNDRAPDLINDLNLKLIAPDGTEYFPFVMPFVGTWTVASMSEPATTGINHTDNVEQVLIENPGQIGAWRAEVSYLGSLTDNQQDYGLLISGAGTAGALAFSPAAYTVAEDGGSVTISVERLGGTDGAVSVDYATADGTAEGGEDYTASTGALIWGDGEGGSKSFDIAIIDDAVSEIYEEMFSVSLSNADGILIDENTSATITIVDNETLMGVSAPNGGESLNVGSNHNIGWASSLGGDVRIELLKNGLLYTTIAGATTNDGAFEWAVPSFVPAGSDYQIRVTHLDGGGESDQSNGTFSIDNSGTTGPGGELSFRTASFTATEDSGSAIITVDRLNGAEGAASVDYATSDGTAIAGSDYTSSSGTLYWVDGDGSSKTFSIPLINDNDHEDFLETIHLTLTNTFGATLVDPNPALLYIQDDDNNAPSVHAGADQTIEWQHVTPAPGLYYGTVGGTVIDTSTQNPQSQILIDVSSETENSIASNTTEMYTGYIYDADGQISFTEHIDDGTRIWIDGTLVLSDDAWQTRVSTDNLGLGPGWHSIEIRIFNGVGGSGPQSSPGIGYDPNGGTDWQPLLDPGDGSFLKVYLDIPGASAELTGTVDDLDGDPLRIEWSLISGPGTADFDDASAQNTTVSFDAIGQYIIQLLTDDGRETVTDRIIIEVVDQTPPSLSSADIQDDQGGAGVFEGDPVTYTLRFNEDMDATSVDAADFSNAGSSAITVDTIMESADGVFSVVVIPTTAGTLQLQISAGAVLTDANGNALDTSLPIVDDTTITVSVRPPNNPPQFISASLLGGDATENAAYLGSLADKANDADEDPLVFAKVSGPAWLSVAADGSLRGTPGNGDLGVNEFRVSVSDAKAPPVEATLTITVNAAPVADNGTITYIDAAEGSSGNTFATGGALDDTSWINPDTGPSAIDNQWKKRAFATNGTIWHSRTNSGAQVELTTQIAGLSEGTYAIWVFFWDGTGVNDWTIEAGLSSGAGTTYSFDGPGVTSATVPADSLTFTNTPMLFEGDRTMYGVNLGWVTVADGATIDVFIDGPLAGSNNRTWYDGVGYARLNIKDIDGPADFANWISDYELGEQSGFDDDYDGDGIPNGIENYFGTNPGNYNAGLTAGVLNTDPDNTFTFSHPINESPAVDITVNYLWSTDLVNFHQEGETVNGTRVNFSQGAISDGVVPVTATISGALTEELFIRIEVILEAP